MKPITIAILTVLGAAALHAQAPIHVDDLIESVRKHYPPLIAALADKEIADAELLTAEGAFDPVFRSRFDSDSFGYYANRRVDSWVEQPLAFQGMSFYSGYRLGSGEFAPYDGKLDTRSVGEFRTGLKLPLIRDREIDSRRGELAKRRIGRKLASLTVDQQRLAILQSALARYWTWVAAGRRLAIAREVLETAEARQRLLEEGVREGQIPAIEASDNQRAILQRRSALVEVERAFQQVSIDLSLFYRDSSGQPVVADYDRVPARFPAAIPLDEAKLADDQKLAIERRPELARFDAQIDQAEVDVKLARNAVRPVVDVIAAFTEDSGSTTSVRRGPQELKAGLAFDLPIRNRAAKGRAKAAEVRQTQLEVRAGFVRDQVVAEVRDAFSAVQAAQRRLKMLSDEVRVSRDLEEAERSRFDLGEGTLFMLNLREQQTMDAAMREVLAQADYQRAMAAYEYSTGALLNR